MPDQTRMRLDQALVARGLAETRARAKDAVLRRRVRIDGTIAEKPGQLVAADAAITIDDAGLAFVSRGALKLAAALDAFGFDPVAKTALDIGASTGGFTDCLLQRGAAHVYAVDVGHGQLHPRLKDSPAVTVMEGTDARRLRASDFATPIQAVTADVSFISLTLALPVALQLAEPGAWLAALVKPQFELEPAAIGKGGLVKTDTDRLRALIRVRCFVEEQGWRIEGEIPSPITGGSGNREFLIGALKPRA